MSCEGQVELRGKSRTPYCRNCHQFITDGRLGDCRARDDGPGTHENQCPDLMPGLPSGKPWLDALGDPYRCELGRDHGGAIHLGGGARWPNKDYSPTIKINNPQVRRPLMSATRQTRPWPYDGSEGRARLTGSLDTGGSFTGDDDDDDDDDAQSTTACCPRETIPDSCSCPDGCECVCLDCICGYPGDDDDFPEWELP